MTQGVDDPVTIYALTGSALGPFDTVWPCEDASEVTVWLKTGTGEAFEALDGSSFTVTGSEPLINGLAVELAGDIAPAAWASGAKVALVRATALDQPSALTFSAGFTPGLVEAILNRAARQAQDLSAPLSRALLAPLGETLGELPDAQTRAGGVLAFNNAGAIDTSKGYAQLVTDVAENVDLEALGLLVTVQGYGFLSPAMLTRDGEFDNAGVINAALAALPEGGELVLPPGKIAWSKLHFSVDGTRMRGSFGGGTKAYSLNNEFDEDDTDEDGFININGFDDCRVSHLKIVSNGHFPTIKARLADNFQADNLIMDGLSVSGGELQGYAILLLGCSDAKIDASRIKNFANGVYCSRANVSTGANCGRVTVRTSKFWHTEHGVARKFPAGVYGLYVDELIVESSEFRNIKPSTNTDARWTGYGVYEGDGECNSVKVINCDMYDDDGDTTLPSVGILVSRAKRFLAQGGEYIGPFRDAIYGRALVQKVADVLIHGPRVNGVNLAGFRNDIGDIATLPDSAAVSNVTVIEAGETGVRFGDGGSPAVPIATVSAVGVTAKRCGRAGLLFSSANWANVFGNGVYDCNTTNQSGLDAACGIAFFGVRDGLVEGNTVMNTAAGSMTAAISGNVLTVSAIISGGLSPGCVISEAGVTVGTKVLRQLTGTSGGAGTYEVSVSQTVSSRTITINGGLMKYGIGCSTATNRLRVGRSNTIIGMTTAPTINLLDGVPTTGRMSAGQEIYRWGAQSGERQTFVATSTGEMGTGSPASFADGLRIGSPETAAATALAAIGNAINTTNKYRGKVVIDTSNNRLVYASAAGASAAWYVVDGSASITPV